MYVRFSNLVCQCGLIWYGKVGIYYLISRGMKSMFSDDSARVGT